MGYRKFEKLFHMSTNFSGRETISYEEFPLTESSPPQKSEFQFGEELGRGGTGVVYLAQQTHPAREVAIKQSHKVSYNRAGLIREAMITGRLEHPNIIPIHQLDISNPSGPQVVMKRINGTNLWELCTEGPFHGKRLKTMLGYLRQVCHALEYAHSKKVIHRDVKPENIMIGNFGEVYLLDWGIAVDRSGGVSNPKMWVGTPAYMAPEMLAGDPDTVDVRTDVYLVGATLHEILTGSPRHDALRFRDLIEQVKFSTKHRYGSRIPKELANICNRACARDPAFRYQSILELRQAIEAHLIHWEAM